MFTNAGTSFWTQTGPRLDRSSYPVRLRLWRRPLPRHAGRCGRVPV